MPRASSWAPGSGARPGPPVASIVNASHSSALAGRADAATATSASASRAPSGRPAAATISRSPHAASVSSVRLTEGLLSYTHSTTTPGRPATSTSVVVSLAHGMAPTRPPTASRSADPPGSVRTASSLRTSGAAASGGGGVAPGWTVTTSGPPPVPVASAGGACSQPAPRAVSAPGPGR